MATLCFHPVKTAEEIRILADLAKEIWNQHFPPIIGEEQVTYMVDKFQSEPALNRQIAEGYLYFLFLIDDTPVGFTGILPQPEEQKLFLSKLYLKQSYRKLGLARQAFSFLQQQCIDRKLNAIWLTVNRFNDDAIQVYQHLGFVVVRRQKANIGGGFYMDDYIMEYSLKEPALPTAEKEKRSGGMAIKYKEIYEHYRDMIESGKLVPGDKMPSEGSMMQQFSASRDTVRKGMTLLEQSHYIEKSRGRESIVLDRSKYEYPVSRITTFTEQLREKNQTSVCETSIEDISILIGNEKAMELLQVDENTEVYRLIRVRRFGGERVIVDKDLLLRSVVPKLNKQICSGSLYEHLEKDLGLKIGLARKVITVEKATREDRMYLDLKDDPVVAVMRSYTQLEDKQLFQYTETRTRIDYFEYEEYAHR